MKNVTKLVVSATIDGEDCTGKVSDNFHTFDELYDHRITLFIKLCEVYSVGGTFISSHKPWRSKNHSDGELAFGGTWFVLGLNKTEGSQITYHIPIERWDETDFAETLERAPHYDGHTPEDVLARLKDL